MNDVSYLLFVVKGSKVICKSQGSDPSTLQLRWLHELRMGRHQAASKTLSQLADTAPPEASLAEVQRTACLSKLAALASLPAWPQEISPAVRSSHCRSFSLHFAGFCRGFPGFCRVCAVPCDPAAVSQGLNSLR